MVVGEGGLGKNEKLLFSAKNEKGDREKGEHCIKNLGKMP